MCGKHGMIDNAVQFLSHEFLNKEEEDEELK